MSRILFCGNIVDEETEYQNAMVSAAGNRFQRNVVNALQNAGEEVTILSYISVPVKEKEENSSNVVYKKTGLTGLLESIKTYNNHLKEAIEKNDIIIAYNINYPWLFLPRIAKKRKKQSYIIMADYTDCKAAKGIARKIYAYFQSKSLKQYDVVIGLSNNITNYLSAKQRYISLVGGITREVWQALERTNSDKHTPSRMIFVYGGLLSHVTGITRLISIMEPLAAEYSFKLIISGRGNQAGMIQDEAEKYDWIDYRGHLPYEQYLDVLREADVLINPRNMDLPENKNNFPSKIIEYLATGAVILSTRFADWAEFEGYIEFSTLGTMNEKISELLAMTSLEWQSYRDDTYKRNREFSKGFLWDVQVQNVVNMITKSERDRE